MFNGMMTDCAVEVVGRTRVSALVSRHHNEGRHTGLPPTSVPLMDSQKAQRSRKGMCHASSS